MTDHTWTISYPEKFIAAIDQVPQIRHDRPTQRIFAPTPQLDTTFQYEKLEEGCYLFVVDMLALEETAINILGDRHTDYLCLSYQLIRGEVNKVPQKDSDRWQSQAMSLPRICSFYNNEFDYQTSFGQGAGVRAFIFCFTPEWIAGLLSLGEIDPALSFMQVIQGRINGIAYFNDHFYRQTYDELDRLLQGGQRSPAYKLVVKKLSMTLIADFFSIVSNPESVLNLPEQPQEFNGVEVVKAHLDKHFPDGFPGLPYLADLAHMSVATLRRQFQRQLGHSAFDYFRGLQMRYAFEQLQQGRQVKQVAASLGYGNASNFARLFRAYYRISPQQVVKL